MDWKLGLKIFAAGVVIGAGGMYYLLYRRGKMQQSYSVSVPETSEYAGIRYNEDGSVARMIGFGANDLAS